MRGFMTCFALREPPTGSPADGFNGKRQRSTDLVNKFTDVLIHYVPPHPIRDPSVTPNKSRIDKVFRQFDPK